MLLVLWQPLETENARDRWDLLHSLGPFNLSTDSSPWSAIELRYESK